MHESESEDRARSLVEWPLLSAELGHRLAYRLPFWLTL